MFSFRLGRIPVQVHFSHLLLAAVLGLGWAPSGSAWLTPAISDPSHPGHTNALMIWVPLFVAMVFVSILTHELGHAVVSLAFGYRPEIQLAWIGGHTRPNANETIPWFKSFALTAAGPLFGFVLAIACFVASKLVPEDTAADAVFSTLAVMNLIWSIFNLFPVSQLDGGQMAEAVLQRVFGRPGFLVARLLSLGVLAGVGLLFYKLGMLASAWNIVLLLLLGMKTVSDIQGYLRGELPYEHNHPTELAFREALGRYQAGKLDEARQLSQEALRLDMAPLLRSRFNHLLGWIAVKGGEGRPALDHFSQVQGVTVEPQALAAAFSLVGDEQRALPLWEAAYRETRDPTILHEWAGSLIRAGREEEATRMQGVELATAYRCAERLLFIRGDFTAAANAGLKALDLRPSANGAYDVACAFARAGDRDQAVAVLQRAVDLGFRDVEYLSSDADLASLHGHRPFDSLLAQLKNSSVG